MNFLTTTVPANLIWVIATVFGALSAGTVVRLVTLRGAAEEITRKRLASLRTWWMVAIAVLAAAVGGVWVACGLFAVVSCLAMAEFARLSRPEPLDGVSRWIAYASILTCYALFAWLTRIEILWLTPIVGALAASLWLAAGRPIEEFTPKVAGTSLGLLWTTTLPALAIASLATELPMVGGGMLFLLLVGLTEINDIAAAIVGRRVGRRRLAPVLSPNKTWEGFVGGVAVSMLIAWLVGSWVTSMSTIQLLQSGLVISIAGTLGDLNMSAIKRCAKVKDSSHLLPGQGGVLDRIDSLTLSAPAFFLLVTAWSLNP